MKIRTLKHVYRSCCSFFLLTSFCTPTFAGMLRYMMKIKVHSMKKISFCPLPLLPVWAIACSIGFLHTCGGRVVVDFWCCIFLYVCIEMFATFLLFFHSKHSLVWTRRYKGYSRDPNQRCSVCPFPCHHFVWAIGQSSLGLSLFRAFCFSNFDFCNRE